MSENYREIKFPATRIATLDMGDLRGYGAVCPFFGEKH